MNDTERIAAMLRGLDCPHADDDYNICRACAAEAAETIDAQAKTIAQLQAGLRYGIAHCELALRGDGAEYTHVDDAITCMKAMLG